MSAPVLSAEELAAIEARAMAATPGPWTAGIVTVYAAGRPFVTEAAQGSTRHDVDAAFIAHAREDIPRLLAALAHMTAVAEAERALRVAEEIVAKATIEGDGVGPEDMAVVMGRAMALRALGVEP